MSYFWNNLLRPSLRQRGEESKDEKFHSPEQFMKMGKKKFQKEQTVSDLGNDNKIFKITVNSGLYLRFGSCSQIWYSVVCIFISKIYEEVLGKVYYCLKNYV